MIVSCAKDSFSLFFISSLSGGLFFFFFGTKSGQATARYFKYNHRLFSQLGMALGGSFALTVAWGFLILTKN